MLTGLDSCHSCRWCQAPSWYCTDSGKWPQTSDIRKAIEELKQEIDSQTGFHQQADSQCLIGCAHDGSADCYHSICGPGTEMRQPSREHMGEAQSRN